MGQFPDVKWPEEYTELTRIDELLHCRICYEYMETSVITPCSHNYCSICIRKFLHYKTQCPLCFENIYEKDLHANRILDEFIASYLSLREKLLSCIKGAELKGENDNFTPSKTNTPKSQTSRSFVRTPKNLFKDSSSPNPNGFTPKKSPSVINHLFNTPSKNNPGSSTADKTPKINSMFALKSEEKLKPHKINGKRVPCPVCSTEISETNINRHLDDCLKRQTSMSIPKVTKNSLEPMPKYVLNIMKDGELRKLLKKYGLSTAGTRKALEKRLQKFSALYNAERDKLVPKSIEELVKLCEGEENAERNMVKQNSSDHMPNTDRKMDESTIEKFHQQYLQRNRDEYQKLIESINDREKARDKPNRSLFIPIIGEDDVPSTSSAFQTLSRSFGNQSDENNETYSSAADNSQYFVQDSDSTNTSYPLQHYSRDDPMRFLALEISTDSPEVSMQTENCSLGKNEPPMGWEIKSEPSEESRNSPEAGISSNPISRSPVFSLGSKNLGNSISEEKIGVNDIFDASTEDNCSDGGSRETRENKSRKFVMKRSKVNTDDQSTDSETDVESSFKFVGRKTTKIKRNRGKKGVGINAPNENGMKSMDENMPVEFESGISSRSNIMEKENSEIDDADDREKSLRRSSRNRNSNISYALNIRGKKALDVISSNIIIDGSDSNDKGEKTFGKSKMKAKREKKESESSDQPANTAMRKSLRKRRKC